MRRFFAKLLIVATLLAFGASQASAELIDLPIETTDKKVELRLYPSIWTSLWEYFFGDDQVEIAFHVYGSVYSSDSRWARVRSQKAVTFLVPKTAIIEGISRGPGDMLRASFRMYYKEGTLHVGLFRDSGFEDINSVDKIEFRLISSDDGFLPVLQANIFASYTLVSSIGLPDGSFECTKRNLRCMQALLQRAALLPRHNGFLLLEGFSGRPDSELVRRSLDYPFDIANVFVLPPGEAEEPFLIECRRIGRRKFCGYHGLLADLFSIRFTIEDLDIEDIRQKRAAIYRWLETHALTP